MPTCMRIKNKARRKVSSKLVLASALFFILCCCANPMFDSVKNEIDKNKIKTSRATYKKYYMREDNGQSILSLYPGVSGTDPWWTYLNLNESKEWSCRLENDINGKAYGYYFYVRAWAYTKIRIEVELRNNDGSRIITLAAREEFADYFDHYSSDIIKSDVNIPEWPLSPFTGINPLAGRGCYLIFRITYVEGTNPLEIYWDGADGEFGHAYIVLPIIE